MTVRRAVEPSGSSFCKLEMDSNGAWQLGGTAATQASLPAVEQTCHVLVRDLVGPAATLTRHPLCVLAS